MSEMTMEDFMNNLGAAYTLSEKIASDVLQAHREMEEIIPDDLEDREEDLEFGKRMAYAMVVELLRMGVEIREQDTKRILATLATAVNIGQYKERADNE